MVVALWSLPLHSSRAVPMLVSLEPFVACSQRGCCRCGLKRMRVKMRMCGSLGHVMLTTRMGTAPQFQQSCANTPWACSCRTRVTTEQQCRQHWAEVKDEKTRSARVYLVISRYRALQSVDRRVHTSRTIREFYSDVCRVSERSQSAVL